MNVKVQVWEFLVRAGSRRVPDGQSIRGKDRVYRARDSRDGDEDGGREPVVGDANIRDVFARYDQDVPGVELPEIEKRHGVLVGSNDGRRSPAGDDVTEGAAVRARLIRHAST